MSLGYAAPLRAVDTIEWSAHDGGVRVQVEKEIRPGDPYQAAHFPDRTVYPGVFIVETVRQAVVAALGERDGVLPELTAVHSLRFLGGMHPGERLCAEIDIKISPPAADGAFPVEVRCSRPDGFKVARLSLEFRHEPETGGADPGPSVARPREAGAVHEFHEIRTILPHGTPMVLIDRMFTDGLTTTATKTISGSEPCYLDLAAGLPMRRYAYPRSLILESFGQAAAVLWLTRTDLALGGQMLMFAAARDCRFHRPVYPGDVLRHEVRLESAVAGTGFATGVISAGEHRIATIGSFIAVVRPEPAR